MGQHLTVYHIKDEFAEKYGDSFKPLLRSPGEKKKKGEEGGEKPTEEAKEKQKTGLIPIDLPKDSDLFKGKAIKAELFLWIPEPSSPSWVAFLEKELGVLSLPKTQSIGAVLFMKIPYENERTGEKKDELFAFTFGGGRYLLISNSYDKKYGLRVALNVIYAGGADSERLRSVASTTRAANTIRTRKQADRRASFEAFGVDTQQDDLDAVTGTPPVKTDFWSSLLSGSESFSSTTDVKDLKGLVEFCQKVADEYRETTYKKPFGWIDNQREITEPSEIENLEKETVRTLIKNPEKIVLAVPAIIDFEQVDHFTFSFDKKKEFPDPGGVGLLGTLKKIESIKNKVTELSKKIEKQKDFDYSKEEEKKIKGIIESLEKERLIAEDNQGHRKASWSLRDCLSGEIEYKERTYILSDGRIHEIRADFLQEINDFVESLPFKEETLLQCCSAGTCEGDYNKDTADTEKTLLLLDQKTVNITGRTTPIEICDLLNIDQENKKCRFIHVKRKLHSSSLSHLFAQGSVSADLFWRSKDYRSEVLKKIKHEEKKKTRPTKATTGDFSKPFTDVTNPQKSEVVYAIIADWKDRSLVDALPFFSKVHLRRHINYLRLIGYNVSIAPINVA